MYFKVTAVSNSFDWKSHVLIQLNSNFVLLLITSSRSWIYHYLKFLRMFKRDNWQISLFEKNWNVASFPGTVKAIPFKLCMIITLLGVYIFMAGLMTLALFQGYKCVRNITFLVYCCCAVWLLHTLWSSYIIWIVHPWCVFKGVDLHDFGQSSVWAC